MGVAALVSGKVAKRSRKASRTTACMRRHAPPSALTNTGVSRLSRARRSEASGVGRDHAAQIGVQVVRDGRSHQKIPVVVRQVGQQQRDELALKLSTEHRHARDARTGVATAQDDA